MAKVRIKGIRGVEKAIKKVFRDASTAQGMLVKIGNFKPTILELFGAD